nr:hypothetical protein [Tanacetum cinerariifolium]
GTYLLTVGTHGVLYELFTADDLKKGLKVGLIEFPCGLGPEDLSGDNSCEGFQVQQAEGFTAFPFLPISAV